MRATLARERIGGMTSRRYDETERSYEADTATTLPGFAVGPVASVEGPVTHDLTAVYHDTDDLRLVRAGMTLRRREGGDDAGWHLKLPAPGGSRVEVHRALGRSASTPVSVRRLVQSVTRGAKLAPVVELVTRREEHRLAGSDGALLALVADDWVQATVLPEGEAPPLAWREVEVELVDGGPEVLAAVDKVLRKSGLRVAAQQSKLRRALTEGHRLDDEAAGKPGSAGEQLRGYLVAQRSALLANDVLVRDGDPAGVHRLRVAARRLRAAMAAYRPLLDRQQSEPLEVELRWLGRELADARDLQVVDERLNGLLDDEADVVAVGPARRLVRQVLRARRRDAASKVTAALDSERYRALQDALDAFTAAPCNRRGRPLGVQAAAAPGPQGLPAAREPGRGGRGSVRRRPRRGAAPGAQGGEATALRVRGGRAERRQAGPPAAAEGQAAAVDPGRPPGHPGAARLAAGPGPRAGSAPAPRCSCSVGCTRGRRPRPHRCGDQARSGWRALSRRKATGWLD